MGLYVTAIMGGAALAASFSPFVQVQTGSWRIGLAIWAGLALLALVFWSAQRAALPALPQAGSDKQEGFFGNGRAWLLAIFLASVQRPTPASWRGWRRTTSNKAGANSMPVCSWVSSPRWKSSRAW